MAGRVIVETARLILREFDAADAEAFYLLGSDPEVIRYTGDPGGGLKSIEQAREGLLTRPMADYRKHGYGRWAVVLKETGAVIGFAGPKFLPELGEADLGYRFLPAFWGRGFATESGRAALDHSFGVLRLERILGLVAPANVGSVRVLEKLGMRYEGTVEFGGSTAAKYAVCNPAAS